MEAAHAAYRPFAVLESVRCLDCGEVYSKPSAGGTVTKNPGCPRCGYVGWIPLSLPAEVAAPRRFSVGRLPARIVRVR
jgi:hypothetical protein